MKKLTLTILCALGLLMGMTASSQAGPGVHFGIVVGPPVPGYGYYDPYYPGYYYGSGPYYGYYRPYYHHHYWGRGPVFIHHRHY